MSEVTVGIIALGVLLTLFMTGIEMGFAMAIVGFAGDIVLVSRQGAPRRCHGQGLSIETFASVQPTPSSPCSCSMGQVAFNAGIAKRLCRRSAQAHGAHTGRACPGNRCGRYDLQGHLRFLCRYYCHLCRSGGAGDGTLKDLSRRLSTGIVAVAGTLGIYFYPLVVVLIIFGMITEQSIDPLFSRRLLPGTPACSFVCGRHCWLVQDLNPEVGVRRSDRLYSWKETAEHLARGCVAHSDIRAHGRGPSWVAFSPPRRPAASAPSLFSCFSPYLRKIWDFQGIR